MSLSLSSAVSSLLGDSVPVSVREGESVLVPFKEGESELGSFRGGTSEPVSCRDGETETVSVCRELPNEESDTTASVCVGGGMVRAGSRSVEL